MSEVKRSTAFTGFKKLNDLISIKEEATGTKFLVNNEWCFTLPEGIIYEIDGIFDGGIEGAADLSGDEKPLILKGLYQDGKYWFNVALQEHFNFFGNYATIEDCKYDNQFDGSDPSASRIVFIDEDDFYAELICINAWVLGNQLELRVRGRNTAPVDFMTTLPMMVDETVWKKITTLFKQIGGSISFKNRKGTAVSAKTEKAKPFGSEFIVDGTVLLKYIGNNCNIEIPEGITAIADNVFSGRHSLKSIILPESVTRIGDRAFENCCNLEYVKLPSKLKDLGRYAFVDCHSLNYINLSKNLTCISDSAFSECYKLKDVEIPKKVKIIDAFAFKNCQEFTQLVLPDGLETISFSAFSNCTNLEYIYIPATVTTIEINFGEYTPFSGCNKLTVYCPEGSYAQQFMIENGIRYEISDKPKKISPTVPPSVPKSDAFGEQTITVSDIEQAIAYKELMDSVEEVDKITEQMDSDLSKYGAYLEAKKKSDEEAKVKKENAKAEALKKGKNDTDASKMYVVLLCEKSVGKLKRSAKDFYEIYEEDFPAYSKEELINLRKDVLALMDDESACEVYSVQFKTLSLEEKFNFATRNLYNLYEGMRVFENYNKALEESKQWYTDDEILHAKKLIDEDLEETKNDLDSQLGAIEEKWLKYSTAKNCLQIFVTDKQADKSDIRADAKDFQTVVGNSLVSVKLATNGAFVMSTIVMDCMPWYWGTTIEQIWQDAFNNEPVDERIINNDTNEIIDKAKVKILGKSSKSKTTVKVDKQEPTNVKTTPKVIVSELDKKESKRLSETGENLLDNGQKQQAFSYFERALKLNPYNPHAIRRKGLRFENGDSIIEKTVKIHNNCIIPFCELFNMQLSPDEQREISTNLGFIISFIGGFSGSVQGEKSYYIADNERELYEKIIKNLGESALYIGDKIFASNNAYNLKKDGLEAWKLGITLCYNNLAEYKNGKAIDYLNKIRQYDSQFTIKANYEPYQKEMKQQSSGGGCYIATCVYGSYDCPQVWTLRRYRDYKLDKSILGKMFIKFYYATSPTLVKWFGNTRWFKSIWKKCLDHLVLLLNKDGYDDTPYRDK